MQEATAAEVTVLRDTGQVRIYGVTYPLALFKALAAKWGAGSFVDVYVDAANRMQMHTHRPGKR